MEKAFELYNRGGRHTSSFRHQLAPAFHDAFKLTGDIGCLDHAIQLYRELLGMQPEGHIYRYSSLYALGKALQHTLRRPDNPSILRRLF
jgi:hypothetical protein